MGEVPIEGVPVSRENVGGLMSQSLSAKFPVYQHFITDGSHDPGQLTYPVILNFTARRTFDLLGP